MSHCRAEHTKENGLPYQSPGLTNGIKLSPQDPRPLSPVALQMTGEKGSEKVRAAASRGPWCGGLGVCSPAPEPGLWGHSVDVLSGSIRRGVQVRAQEGASR